MIKTIASERFPAEQLGKAERLIKGALAAARNVKKWADRLKAVVEDSPENLELTESRAKVDANRAMIAEFFQQLDETEQIITASGVAERKVAKAFELKVENIPALKDLFGDQFDTFISTRPSYGLTADGRALLGDGDSPLGLKLRDYVTIEPKVTIEFKEPK